MTLHTLVHGVILLSLPWLIAEIVAQNPHFRRSRLARRARTPLVRSRTADHSSHEVITVSRGKFWIKLETTAFNALPSALLARAGVPPTFARRAQGRTKYFGLFYDAGNVFAALALVLSLLIIVWGTFGLIGQIVDFVDKPDQCQADGSPGSCTTNASLSLQRRQLSTHMMNSSVDDTKRWSPNLVPLIPGLTLPWSHAFPLFVALSFTQVVHEAGHAICGALHDLPPIRMGIMLLYPAIPGAFVVLPREASRLNDDFDDESSSEEEEEGLQQEAREEVDDDDDYDEGKEQEESSLREKMRIISAGVWHNALSAFVIGLLLLLPIGRALRGMLFVDAGGMRIHGVDASSPLSTHIARGALISALDDTSLSSSDDSQHRFLRYTAFLSAGTTNDENATSQGWCVNDVEWQKSSTSCCERWDEPKGERQEEDVLLSNSLCYRSFDGTSGRCFDPVKLTEDSASRCMSQCSNDAGSGGEQICIRPDLREELLRIAVRQSTGERRGRQGKDRVILFQGSREAVRAALRVSSYDFRFVAALYWPERLFAFCASVVQYAFTLSVAMALFNMLPLPSLDGDIFMQMLFAFAAQRYGKHTSYRVGKRTKTDSQNFEDDVEMNARRGKTRARSPSPQQNHSSWSSVQRTNGTADTHVMHDDTTRHFRPLPKRRGGEQVEESVNDRTAATATQFPQRVRWPARRSSHTKTLSQIHVRIRWTTMALALFVMGGSIVMHVIDEK